MEHEDACFAPVLDAREAISHPHAVAREAYFELSGVTQPAPVPRFSRSRESTPTEPPTRGRDTDVVLLELGLRLVEIAALRDTAVVG